MYSALTESIVSNFFEAPLSPTRQAALDALTIDDGDELRLGFEYLFTQPKHPVALRLGGWESPAHKIFFDGEPGPDGDTRAQSIQFRGGDDELHVAAGIGIVFASFQIDGAADFSDAIDTVSLSAVVRF